jgi:hypothetical protein
MKDFDLLPAIGALANDERLEYREVLPVLGIDTEFLTNSQHVRELVDDAFGTWRQTDRRLVGENPRLTIRIVVADGDEGEAEHAPIRHYYMDRERLVAHSPGSIGITNPPTREAMALVSAALVADRDHFRVAMLEAITFALLAQFDRHPLHAAAVAHDNRVVLLAGETGAGKSTLAYLAFRAGLGVLAEDHVWIELEPELRVWGGASRLRLDATSTAHFPELASVGETTTVGGKTKFAIQVSSKSLVARDAVVCLLSRGAGSARLERADATAITAALTTNVAPGFDAFPERHERVVRTLAARGGWRLELSPNPRDALPLLDEMLRRDD